MIKNISNLRLDILDSARQSLLEQLLSFTENFVLAGGTGLALQIAHRKSFDFDFFSEQQIAKNFLERISQTIDIDNISVDSTNELTFYTKDKIKITFLHYPFKHADQPIQIKENLRLFTIQDIARQKAYTIGRRGEYRDYFDLYTILKRAEITFIDLIRTTKQLYGSVFDEKLFLEQLVYFNDLRNFSIIPVDQEPLPKPDEIKQFFIHLADNFAA